MRPLWKWPSICWMLTGLPGYVLFVVLGHLAANAGWWNDPHGLWATCCGLVGLMLGAGLWWLLTVRSERRQNPR